MKISSKVWDKFTEVEKEFIIKNQSAGLTQLKKIIKIANKKFPNKNIKYVRHGLIEVENHTYKVYSWDNEKFININTLEIL